MPKNHATHADRTQHSALSTQHFYRSTQHSVFQRLRWRAARNAGTLLLGNSRVRLATIVVCCLLIAGTVFAGSYEGFELLQTRHIPFSGRLVGILFDFLFLALAILLIFSGGLILYGSLFSAAETTFLLSTPARADQVFAYKFQTAIGFSSWAFLLLGIPILVSYGVVFAVPWYYYALLPVYFLGFLLVPGSIGAIACFLVVNITPQRRKQVLAICVGILVLSTLWWTYQTFQELRNPRSNRDALSWLDARFAFSRASLMPSHWMTRGLQSAARGDLVGAAYPLALLWANGLMVYLMAAWTAGRLYRRGFNRLATGGAIRKRYGGARLDRLAGWMLRPFEPQTRLLIIKDLRTFRRDPAQWAQIVIFAGLMLLYYAISPQFYQTDRGRSFQHVISFTNLTATAMLTCAYMSRFVYPMLSLEGRKFWILGLLPLPRERLLWGKFAFSATGGAIVGASLVTVSDLLLGMPIEALGLHLAAVIVLAVGLSGLSVGIGAIVPNFRETDPSRIAVGFGGTLNLIAGLLYLLVVLGLMVGPYHLAAGMTERDVPAWVWKWVVVGLVAGATVGGLAAMLPLRAGAAALRRMEF
jgi:ABC-2 type transport system permease protein